MTVVMRNDHETRQVTFELNADLEIFVSELVNLMDAVGVRYALVGDERLIERGYAE